MAPAASLPRLALLVRSVAIRPPAQPKISTSFRLVAPFSAAPMPAARTAGVVGSRKSCNLSELLNHNSTNAFVLRPDMSLRSCTQW
jgi:hypothetical protein